MRCTCTILLANENFVEKKCRTYFGSPLPVGSGEWFGSLLLIEAGACIRSFTVTHYALFVF